MFPDDPRKRALLIKLIITEFWYLIDPAKRENIMAKLLEVEHIGKLLDESWLERGRMGYLLSIYAQIPGKAQGWEAHLKGGGDKALEAAGAGGAAIDWGDFDLAEGDLSDW